MLVLIARGHGFESRLCNFINAKQQGGVLLEWTANKIKELVREDRLYRFYKSNEWMALRAKVLKEYHNECAWCREKGKISIAETVHHIQWVKKYPELALKEYYTYHGRRYRNLVPLCHDCHDKAHNRMKYKKKEKQFNEERW